MKWIWRRTRRQEERGAILVLAALCVSLVVICAALAIDLGSVGVLARELQKVSDLAALDGARVLPANPTTAAEASALRNEFNLSDPRHSLTVEWSDSLSGVFTSNALLLPLASYVKITASAPHDNDFAIGSRMVSRSATASLGNGDGCFLPDICVPVGTTTTTSTIPVTTTTTLPGATTTTTIPTSDRLGLGTVRVGSTLATASSSDATLLNRLLTQTVGGTYTLNAVGWQGLANASVSMSRLRTALSASTGTLDSVLDANIKYRALLDATISALEADGSTSADVAADNLALIAAQVTTTAGANFQINKLFDVYGNVGSGKDVADAALNVKDIVVGGMILADGDHFASINLTASDIPALPGTGVTVKVGLIEAPQTKSGPPRSGSTYYTVAKTAQLRFQVIQNLDVSVLGVGLLSVSVPYYLEAGSAEAKLDAVVCSGSEATPTRVDILGSTTVGKTVLGAVSDANLANTTTAPTPTTATLVNALGITVNTNSTSALTVNIPGNSGELLSFDPPYTTTSASQEVDGTQSLSVHTLASSNLSVSGTLLGSLVASTVTTAVNALLGDLTSVVLRPLFRALGLSFASADVWAPPPQTCQPTSFNIDSGASGTTPVRLPVLVG